MERESRAGSSPARRLNRASSTTYPTDRDPLIGRGALEEDTAELREVLNVHARDRIMMLLDGLSHGVLSMSREVPGLVESSSNLAVVKTGAASASFVMSHRSSIMPALFAIRHQVASICKQADAEVT